MKTLPNLYKDVTNEKGKVSRRIWKCEIYNNSYITYSGVENGKLIPKPTNCFPKNIGKANETTFKEQTEKEAGAKWTKMVERQLYKENPDDGIPPLYIMPMLALDYNKVPKRLKWQEDKFCVQPKLNGVRFIARKENGKVVLRSRKGKIYSVSHIEKELFRYLIGDDSYYLKRDYKDLAIDGELYLPNTQLGDIASAVKNKENTDHKKLEAQSNAVKTSIEISTAKREAEATKSLEMYKRNTLDEEQLTSEAEHQAELKDETRSCGRILKQLDSQDKRTKTAQVIKLNRESEEIQAKNELQKVLDTTFKSELARVKARSDQELAAQRTNTEIATAGFVTRLKAVDPKFAQTLHEVVNSEMLAKVAESMGPVAMLTKTGVLEVLAQLMTKTSLADASVLKELVHESK